MLKFKILLAFVLAFCASALAQTQKTTEHGYRYFHHIQKTGPKPQRGESILANVDVYVGKFSLSSSKKTVVGIYRYDIPPADATLGHYPPIMDAALLMSKGDSLTIFQPVDETMRTYLPPAEKEAKEIRFEIVLTDIVTLEQKSSAARSLDAAVQVVGQKVQATAKAYSAGSLSKEIHTHPSGLKMLVEAAGNGARVQKGEVLQVHYYGCLTNGTPFNNSYSSRQPLQFAAGEDQMIAGFDEGVMYLNHGSRAYLFIPPALGYGDEVTGDGIIPANSELVFYIEIL
ncbi:MAG: FKBP-type peptidyl-prolyl cis-trans isomerase [Saprospiraceae bacterium]